MKNGDSNVITREYFDSLLLEMRHIDGKKADTSVRFFGEKFDTPIATAALSHLNNTATDGMANMALGAKNAGALCFSGMGEYEEIKAMCDTGAKVIKIIKPHLKDEMVFEKIEEAKKAGCFGIGMDIDHAFAANGEYDHVCGFDMEPKSLEQLRSFIEAGDMPFVVKGVLSLADAKKALAIGADAIIVSHHHGIMDYAVPPLMILPKIAEYVNKKIPIFVDCCIESGMDAFKALALGADGVCVGRAIMEPLKENGAQGVTDTMNNMNATLKMAMSRCGFSKLSAIDDSVIWHRDF